MNAQFLPSTRGPFRRLLMITAFLCILAIPAGCKSYADYDAFIRTPRPMVTLTDYRLQPPDQILITSKRVRELASHEERVRPDGKITLPLLGAVYVAGKTPEEVTKELRELAKAYYDDADITLRVSGFNSKKIYVWGEVAIPGPYTYDGANTLQGTLARAQPTRLAEFSHIHILRPGNDGKLTKRMTINLYDMIERGDTKLDTVLEEGDIIYVPANGLATVGLTLQQILLPIQPAAATVKGPSDIYDNSTYPSSSNNSR